MKNKQLSLIFFLIIQLYIYTAQISFTNLVNLKILSIISILLCFILSLSLFCKTKDYFIMICAISLTLISDIFHIFFNNLTAIILFILNTIQILYFLRTYIDSDYKKLNLLTRIITIPTCVSLGFILLKDKIDIIAILWIIYTTNIFLNILFTIKDIGVNNFFPIGLIFLFIHSSLMMFLFLENYTIVNIPFVNFLQELPFDIRTMFYLPAQVILTCSIFTVNRKSFSKIKHEEN